MKHLKDNNITYWGHWWFAMKLSIALFIHAWFPNLFTNYASDKICSKQKEVNDVNITDYF